MPTKKQHWAQKRNWLIARVKGAYGHSSDLRNTLPDIDAQVQIAVYVEALKRLETRLEKLNTYEKYQAYLEEVKRA